MRRPKRFYLYILASKSRRLYVGVTSNPERRLWEHRNGLSDFTNRYNINRLVHLEAYNLPQRAIAREKEIKGWLRAKKVALIESENPTWEDLSADWGKPFTYPGKR